MQNNIDNWDESDLQKFIDLKISENINLEYKREVHLKKPNDKKELCKDVSAFSNSQGGQIIIGLEEVEDKKNGSIPGKLNPIFDLSIKEDIQKILLDGIKPLLDFRILSVKASSEGEYIIIEIPKSLRGLHMVTLGGLNKYYKRYDFESRPMNPYEIEDSYKQYLLVEKNIEQRLDLLDDESQNIYPSMESGVTWLSIKSIPRFGTNNMFIPIINWDRDKLVQIHKGIRHKDILDGSNCFNPVYEGLRAIKHLDDPRLPRYQYYHTLYRSGIAVFGFRVGKQGVREIYPVDLIYLLHSILSFLSGIYSEIGYQGTCDIMVTWYNIKDLVPTNTNLNLRITYGNENIGTNIFEHHLITTPGKIEINCPETLHELLDHFWQSFGMKSCNLYKEKNNNYIPQMTIKDNNGDVWLK